MAGSGAISNKFTSVSVRGTSVVDYTLVPIGHFSKFSKFHVEYVTDLITELDILVDKSLSDHSVLCWSYSFKVCTVANSPQLTVHSSTRLPRVKIPENYLTDPSKSCSINKLTSSINKLQQRSHPTVSYLYDEFCSLILQEIPVKPKQLGKGPRGRNKKWWDSELSSARSKLRKACKSWLKCKNNTDNKQEFIRAQRAFDSLVRKKKRNYQHSSMLLQQKQNSRQFWKKVKKLGVAGIESQSIPMEVELEDGSIIIRQICSHE